MYKHIFGPVPSRRLGMSLGIDLIPPKICSLDCVYCEVGKTTELTINRKEYVSFEDIKSELMDYLDSENPDPDFFTFSGYGEPTLNSKIGDIIDLLKSEKPHIPVAVLTNASLFNQEDVRKSLLKADLVLPSLDAVIQESFIRINRPENSLKVDAYIQGLIDFRNEYSGKMFLEVFILPDFNDSDEDISALRDAIMKINPDKVQLNTLDRPGVEENIRAATRSELLKIKDILDLPYVEIIASAPTRKSIRSYRQDAENAILETLDRRPCTLDDIHNILGLHMNEINKYLDVLESEGKIERKKQARGVFYQTLKP